MKLHQFLKQVNERNEIAQELKSKGKSKNQPDDRYDPIELEVGTQVELEHIDDKESAKEIAKDHLEEDPHYYIQALSSIEDEVMQKTMKILKKHGYEKIDDFLDKSDF